MVRFFNDVLKENLVCEVEGLMSKKTGVSQESAQKLHLRYIRLPNHVLELYNDLVYRSERAIVDKAQIASAHSVIFDGEAVLASGFEIVYFDFIGKWWQNNFMKRQRKN
jgi:predicted RNA-binding protein associated with RNAse of E/G family